MSDEKETIEIRPRGGDKTFELLEKRISELEAHDEQLREIVRKWNQEILSNRENIAELREAIDNIKHGIVNNAENINELEERGVHYHHWVQSKLDEYDNRILISEKNREVLRELFYRMADNEDLSKVGYDLLEKLDSQGMTECKHEWVNSVGDQIRCDKCDILKTEKKLVTNRKLDGHVLQKNLDELRDTLQKSGVKWDFRLDEQGGFITELKEYFDLDSGHMELHRESTMNREILRDLGKKVYDYIGAKNFGSWNDFIEKLDSQGKTEKKELPTECKRCDYDFDEDCGEGCCKLKAEEKASGGEKDISEADETRGDCFRLTNREDASTHLSDDSKPLETIDCMKCKYYLGFHDVSMFCVKCAKNGYSKYELKEERVRDATRKASGGEKVRSAAHTVKICWQCKNAQYGEDLGFYEILCTSDGTTYDENSGCEKFIYNPNHSEINPRLHTGSKPPEPIFNDEMNKEFRKVWKEIYKIINRHWISDYQWSPKEVEIIRSFDKRIKEEIKLSKLDKNPNWKGDEAKLVSQERKEK